MIHFSSQSSKASSGAYGGKGSTKHSNRRSAKKEGFERQPSEISFELGEIGGRGGISSTTIKASRHPEHHDITEQGITKTQDVTIAL